MGAILSVNGGSSSLKCGLFLCEGSASSLLFDFSVQEIFSNPVCIIRNQDHAEIQRFEIAMNDSTPLHAQAVQHVIEWLQAHPQAVTIGAIGHRVVHGGMQFSDSTKVDSQTIKALEELIPLAPLHQAVNVSLIETCHSLLPNVPQVACFDTAFHHHRPLIDQLYALPKIYTDSGVRAFGFHGLSYEYVFSQLLKLDEAAAKQKIVIAHLGAGASLCAIKQGQCVSTTMGFSALEGLAMATRTGRIDPGVLLYLMRHYDLNLDQLEEVLYKKSGLLGLSGISGDMKALRALNSGAARGAIEYFVYRAIQEIGALVAVMGGLDALVFTGGIGENDPLTRQEICQAFSWLDLYLGNEANNQSSELVSHSSSRVSVRVIETDEQAMIARHTARVLRLE